jgi:DNA-binding NarL/FixJ family response regulator
MGWQSVNVLLDHEEPSQLKVWDRRSLDERLISEAHLRGGYASDRAVKVLRMYDEGHTYRQIASYFGIDKRVVENIIRRNRR